MIAQAGVLSWPEVAVMVVLFFAVFGAACYWQDERPRRRRQRELDAARLRRRELRVSTPVGRTADGVQVDVLVRASETDLFNWPNGRTSTRRTSGTTI